MGVGVGKYSACYHNNGYFIEAIDLIILFYSECYRNGKKPLSHVDFEQSVTLALMSVLFFVGFSFAHSTS